jgi:hypothetical protein
MSITIADYSYRQLITGNAPASSLSGFVALITEANVDSTFFDNVDNGGGDVRVSINSDGTSQLPLEIVLCNTATDKLIAWVRFPTYSTSARELYVFSRNTGQTQPAVTATYGRNNVWQDQKRVYHLDGSSFTDSTGSSDLVQRSGSTPPTRTGPFDSPVADFDGSTTLKATNGISAVRSMAVSVWVLRDTGGPSEGAVFGTDDITNDNIDFGTRFDLVGSQTDNTDTYKSAIKGNIAQGAPSNSSPLNVWHRITLVKDGDTGRFYKNGTELVNWFLFTETLTVVDLLVGVGQQRDEWQGGQAEFIIQDSVPSPNTLSLEYANQSNPATFWTQSTPDDPSGGGGGTEYDLTLNQGVYSLTGQPVSLLNERAISLDQGSYDLTGQPVDLLTERAISLDQGNYSTTGAIFTFDYVVPLNYNFLLNQGIYSITGQIINLLTERAISLDQGNYDLTGQPVSLLTERAISLDQGSYDITGQPVSLLANRSLSLDQGNYDVTGQPVNLLADRVLDLQQGSYTITGRSITFRYIETNAYNLVLGQGSYSTIGSDFTFDYVVPNQYNITLASGSYSTTGDEVSLLVERMLTMGAGSYSSEGLPITALFHRQLTMDAGVYTTVGSSVSIAYIEFSGFEIGSYSISFVQTPVQAYYDDLLVNTTYKH